MTNSFRNERYYDKAYASNSLIKALIKLHLSYDQLSKTRRNIVAIKNRLKSSVPLSVLDFGFGHGTFLYRVPRIHKVAGYELSSEAIRNIKRLFVFFRRDIEIYHQDELFIPSNENKFDLIYCSHVLEHIDNDLRLLSDFHKCLKDDGTLLLNVPVNEVWKDPNHVHEYCSETIGLKLQNTGFAIESTQESDKWTAYILDKEYVSRSVPKIVFRAFRLFLVLLPIALLDFLEKVLSAKYRFQ